MLRPFGLASGGALLAKGAVGAGADEHGRAIALARYHAEWLSGEILSLAAGVIEETDRLTRATHHLDIGRSPP
jgi:hypothetical protein